MKVGDRVLVVGCTYPWLNLVPRIGEGVVAAVRPNLNWRGNFLEIDDADVQIDGEKHPWTYHVSDLLPWNEELEQTLLKNYPPDLAHEMTRTAMMICRKL